MKILIIGCGSIGQRHIRNLLKMKSVRLYAFDIDAGRLRKVRRLSPRIKVSGRLDRLWEEAPEVVFITTPTSLHVIYALEAAERGCDLFIEKPLSDNMKGVKKLLRIASRRRLVTMVGCNMRFYWAIAKIKNLLEKGLIGRVLSARIETGQYLPGWRPQYDYRLSYSAKKNLGGGVILDAIHEIDYALWFFGAGVKKVLGMYGKLSGLEIDTEDVAEMLLRFKNGPIVNIHMDYLQRFYSRSCKIIGEKGTITWDFTQHCLRIYTARTGKCKVFGEPKGYDSNRMYVDEVEYFLDCVKKRKHSFNDIRCARETLKVALAVKGAG